jgi:O-antigen ligase
LKLNYSTILKWAFICLCIILFCNLNGVVLLLFNITAPFSPLILVLALLIIYLGIIKSSIKIGFYLLSLIIFFYISYIFIGLCGYFINPDTLHDETSILLLLRSYLSSIIIIFAFYIGARNFILQGQLSVLLRIIFSFTLLSILFVVFGPYIGLKTAIQVADIASINPERETGLFANPNEAGAFGLYFIIICFSIYGFFRKGSIFFILSLSLGLYVVFTSFSRASMLLTVLIILSYVIYNLKYSTRFRLSNSKRPVLMFTIIIIGAVFIFQNFFTYIQSLSYSQRTRLMQTFQLVSGDINKRTTSERSELYAFAWEEIKKRPITGYGLGTFHRMKSLPGWKKLGVHNTHLLIFGESGIIPIFAFCLFFLLLGLSGWNHDYPSLGFFIIGVCLTYFLNVAGSGHNALDDRTSNALIGIAIAFSQIKRSTK